MRDHLIGALFVSLICALFARPDNAAEDDIIARSFCDSPPYDRLCPVLPKDNIDFDASFIYVNLQKAAQDPFDIFSWQSFVALNWPAQEDGNPAGQVIGSQPNAPRVWQFFKQPEQVFALRRVSDICGNSGNTPAILATRGFLQTSGLPLIDRNLNYVVYDTRMNEVSEQYIVDKALNTRNGQKEFARAKKTVDFPLGHYANVKTKTGGDLGALELKTSWKIIDTGSGDNPDRYYTMDGRIAVAPEHSATGEPMCISARLGLVGMHIMRRTTSGNGDEWIWSTFEHVDAAPIADNSLDPNDSLGQDLFAGGCRADTVDEHNYLFFDPDCRNCPTNVLHRRQWKWAVQPPYARAGLVNDRFGTQVVRCWDIFESTAYANKVWRQKLKDTVWENYRLVTTQWRGGQKSQAFPNGEVPRYLTNVTIETYDQYSYDGTCLGCHAKAATLIGEDANFSFFLRMAE